MVKLERMFCLQSELDAVIIKSKNIKVGEKITKKKVIAFKTEFGEFLNEVRDFKFWSNKPSSEKGIVLEEFVDGVHFLLTISLDRGYEKWLDEIEPDRYLKESFDDLSLNVFNNRLTSCSEVREALEMMLSFALKLGFAEEDVIDAYLKKNIKNLKRQEEGY